MKTKHKKVILIDLDGVLNTYTGTFDKDIIPDIKEGAFQFVENLSKTYEVKLFTTRNRLLAVKWLINNKLDNFITDVTNVKEPASLYIDDRSITFNGSYQELQNKIDNFSVWYKK